MKQGQKVIYKGEMRIIYDVYPDNLVSLCLMDEDGEHYDDVEEDFQVSINDLKTFDKKEFDFVLDTKMTIWSRQKFTIEAANLDAAKEIAKKMVEDGEEIDPYAVDFIYETEEEMTPEQNEGHATIVLMYKEKNNSIIYKNANK